MDITYSPPSAQALTVLYSLIVGVCGGIVYDVTRLFSALVSPFIRGRVMWSLVRALLDIVFSTIYTVMTVLLIYAGNAGAVRYFMILFTAAGTALYLLTAGRLTVKLFCAVSAALIKLTDRICIHAISAISPLVSAARERRLIARTVRKMKHNGR